VKLFSSILDSGLRQNGILIVIPVQTGIHSN